HRLKGLDDGLRRAAVHIVNEDNEGLDILAEALDQACELLVEVRHRLEAPRTLLAGVLGADSGDDLGGQACRGGLLGSRARGARGNRRGLTEQPPAVQAAPQSVRLLDSDLEARPVLLDALCDRVDDGSHEAYLAVRKVLETPRVEADADEPPRILLGFQTGADHLHQAALSRAPAAIDADGQRQEPPLGKQHLQLVHQVVKAQQVGAGLIVMPHRKILYPTSPQVPPATGSVAAAPRTPPQLVDDAAVQLQTPLKRPAASSQGRVLASEYPVARVDQVTLGLAHRGKDKDEAGRDAPLTADGDRDLGQNRTAPTALEAPAWPQRSHRKRLG